MANPIVEEFEKLQKTIIEEREQNEKLIKAQKDQHETTIAAQQVKLAELDKVVTQSQQNVKGMLAEKEQLQARLEMLEALAERPKGSPEEQKRAQYNAAFFDGLRKGFQDPNANAEIKEMMKKDVTIGTNAAGGFALPKEIGATVDALLLKQSEIVANVKMIQVGTSDYQELVSIHGGTSGWVSETGSRSATNTPNLRSQKPTWGELYAYPQVSEWSIQDMQFNVSDWLTTDIAEGMAVALSLAIWNGNGSGRPTGMTNTAPVTTDDHASPLRAAAAYEFIAETPSPAILTRADDIISLTYALNPRYRANARFAMNTITQGVVRKMKDTNGQYLWQPSLQAGQPDMLLGYSVFTWEEMGNPTTVDALPVAFGDFRKAYLLTHRTELMIQSESITNPGYVRFYVRRRYGGFPLNNDAVKFLKNSD